MYEELGNKKRVVFFFFTDNHFIFKSYFYLVIFKTLFESKNLDKSAFQISNIKYSLLTGVALV